MSKVPAIQFDDLNFLLKASSKQQVIDLLNKAFEHRESSKFPNLLLQHAAEALTINISDATKLITAIRNLLNTVLFQNLHTSEEVIAIFPDKFHKNLAELLTKIIVDNLPTYKGKVIRNLVSLPRAVEYSWRVDMKMASGTAARINQPTCILHLKIEDPILPVDHKDKLAVHNIELSKEQVDVMLEHLGRVRDQLGAVAKK